MKISKLNLLKINKGGKKMAGKFEIYKDRADEYRFRLKVIENGKIIAVSEGYSSKQGCENGINSVKENAPNAEVDDLTDNVD